MEQARFSLEEAHRQFAIETNGVVWELLGKTDRTPDEDELMILAAHASCYHWLQVGTGLHHQRGEWLLARVFSVLEKKESALWHAQRCGELTERKRGLMQDFDLAYAHEGLARALALAGEEDAAREHLRLAIAAGAAIADAEDRSIFMGDLDSGEWFGIR